MKHSILIGAVVCWLALLTGSASAEQGQSAPPTKRFVPTLGLETGMYRERLTIDLDEAQLSETRSLWVTRLAFGLSYPLGAARPGAVKVRGQSSLGFGLVYEAGQWPLHTRQEELVQFTVLPWLAPQIGLGTGFQLNLTDPSLSYWEVGLPVGVSITRHLELIYYPMLTVGIGAEERPVFGGTRTHGVATGFAPFNLMLRVRFGGLAF